MTKLNKDLEEMKKRLQQPIKLRENILAKPNKKWWQIWKKETEYGKRIKLTSEQTKEANILEKEGKEIILNIKEENYKTIPEPETIEPLLLLMKENGYTDVLENIKAGEFIISTPKGEKSIWLTPDKQTTLKIGEKYYKGWIAYENCMTPYPEDPMYSAELQRKIIQKVAINYADVNQAKIIDAQTKRWLYIIGAIIVGLVLVFSTEFGKNLLSGGGAQTITQTAVQAVKTNITANTINTGVIVQ